MDFKANNMLCHGADQLHEKFQSPDPSPPHTAGSPHSGPVSLGFAFYLSDSDLNSGLVLVKFWCPRFPTEPLSSQSIICSDTTLILKVPQLRLFPFTPQL
jgi:hypothetical protein